MTTETNQTNIHPQDNDVQGNRGNLDESSQPYPNSVRDKPADDSKWHWTDYFIFGVGVVVLGMLIVKVLMVLGVFKF